MFWRPGEQLLFLGDESCPSSWRRFRNEGWSYLRGREASVPGGSMSLMRTQNIFFRVSAPLWCPAVEQHLGLLPAELPMIYWKPTCGSSCGISYVSDFEFLWALGLVFFLLLSCCHWAVQPRLESDFLERVSCWFMPMLCPQLSVHVSKPLGDIHK